MWSMYSRCCGFSPPAVSSESISAKPMIVVSGERSS